MSKTRQIAQNIAKHIWMSVFVIFVAFALSIICKGTPDGDTYFILATGRYIVEQGQVPNINPFVIHEGFSIVVQQWLFDVIIYGIYDLAGYIGLYIFELVWYALCLVAVTAYVSLFAKHTYLRIGLVSVAGISFLPFVVVRPTLFSFLVMTITLCILEQSRRGAERYLVFLPLLSLVQINMHASMWIMMFVLMLPYVFSYTLPQKHRLGKQCKIWLHRNAKILLTAVIMFLAGFVNPYGIDAMAYVIKSYFAVNKLPIGELAPATMTSITGILCMLAGCLIALYVYIRLDKWKMDWYNRGRDFCKLYLACGTLLLAASHIRNTWLLILGVIPVAASVLTEWMAQYRKKEQKDFTEKYRTWQLYVLEGFILLLALFGAGIVASDTNLGGLTDIDKASSPVKAAEYLDDRYEDKSTLTLFTEFNNGAYMEFAGYQVYMDARPELFSEVINTKEDIMKEYLDLWNGNMEYGAFLDTYDFTHLIVENTSRLRAYLSALDEYRVVVEGDGYTMYEHDEGGR